MVRQSTSFGAMNHACKRKQLRFQDAGRWRKDADRIGNVAKHL